MCRGSGEVEEAIWGSQGEPVCKGDWRREGSNDAMVGRKVVRMRSTESWRGRSLYERCEWKRERPGGGE